MTFLYNLKSTPTGFAMAKLDSDWNVAAVYNLTPTKNGHHSCDCPANLRAIVTKLCKHRKMLPLMLGAVNTDRFYDPETRSWCQPLGDPHRVDPEQVVGEALGSPEPTKREASQIADEKELYGSMSPGRKELLEEGKAMNERQAAKIEAINNLSKLVGFDVTDDNARPEPPALRPAPILRRR